MVGVVFGKVGYVIHISIYCGYLDNVLLLDAKIDKDMVSVAFPF